ncbi:vWA domain-containing protein [Arenibacter certesii]|uniref:VWA domain-containing protein n=1 Tax=Arenibacter certesii TaxID=228955 RepID=A0A918MIZ6_9FLAO|nr:vWA domain-containing protein [Arenibacter certesii]GGW25725.1 hypothetical protein GCM10007383_08120 [Arenibacter certesii]
MQTNTVLFILLAAIASLALVLFQYKYRTKGKGKLLWGLSLLRFISVFGLLLLLINPKYERRTLTTEKANLVFLVDNSSSIRVEDGEKVDALISALKASESPLLERFNLVTYTFGNELQEGDSLTLNENNTNISKALAGVNGVYGKLNTAVVLFSDGNQTLGEDYEHYGKRQNLPIYPIVLGDTTSYEDIRIVRVNSNRYAFLDNKFPIEIFVSYEGKQAATSELRILVNNKLVHKEKVSLSMANTAKTVNAQIWANSVGVKNIRVQLTPLTNEKNIRNNESRLALEVLDEKTNIGIISNILHPDIGALKKIVESNEQRSANLYKPNVDLAQLESLDLYILYQPDASFDRIYKQMTMRNSNYLIIGGTHTDWQFLNKVHKGLHLESGYPVQEVFADLNPAFSKFDISDFTFNGFPPLETDVGPVMIFSPHESLLNMSSKGISMHIPLLAVIEEGVVKSAFLFGENIWKWRMHSFKEEGSFKNFDDFFGKLMLYLNTNSGKNRFSVAYNPIYNNSNDAIIQASYFDEAFRMDPNASIRLNLKDSTLNSIQEIPMLLKGNHFEADLRNLDPGNYSFTATVEKENLSKSGSFAILDFDVEKQFTSSNYKKLSRLADNTGGELFFPQEMDSLLNALGSAQRYVPTQKSKLNVVPLIDFKIVLGIIVLVLALEWFIRKYNGLT